MIKIYEKKILNKMASSANICSIHNQQLKLGTLHISLKSKNNMMLSKSYKADTVSIHVS